MTVPTTRARAALFFLTLGGFAVGCNEFVAMGVLPQVAGELGPTRPGGLDAATASISVFVWGYALGVVLGAPLLGILSHRFGARGFVVASLAGMAVMTAGTALAPGLSAVVLFRILSGLPHATAVGVAAVMAGSLLGRRHAARGVAVVVGGLTIANMIGAPLGTWLAQAAGWRAAYLLIAALFVVAAVGTLLTVRTTAAPPSSGMSWRALGNGRLWRTIAVYALVNAGMFAVLTFTAPLVTSHAGIVSGLTPWAVATTGVGMTIGNYVGGAVADRSRVTAVLLGLLAMVAGFAAMAIPDAPAFAFAGLALLGFALGELAPYTQTLLMRSTPEHPRLGSSMNSLCANVGSVIGGTVAGMTVATSGNAAAAIWTGIALSATGWVATALFHRR